MDEDRTDRIWASIYAVARLDGTPVAAQHACIAAARAVGAVGAGLSMARGTDLREPVFATDPLSQGVEELQFTLGEGPCVDAESRDEAVLAADLSAAESRLRWPMFAPAAAEQGIGRLVAIPIRIGAAHLGVLDLYWTAAGSMSLEKLADALAYADALLMLLLDKRGGAALDPESPGHGGLAEWRAEVHQATGMVSVQLNVDVTEAIIRLRAYAYLNDRRLAEVAAAVVARQLRFGPNGQAELDPSGDTSPPDGQQNGGSEAQPPTDTDKEGEG